MESLPEPVIERCGKMLVLRDDLLPGGTKRRVIGSLLIGGDEFVYAGPCCGYAQVAVAYGAADAGKSSRLFVAKRAERHGLTNEAERVGATLVEVSPGYLSVVRARAAEYCQQTGAAMLPFGLDCDSVRSGLTEIAKALPIQPHEVWTVAGSGMLTRALQAAWPQAKFFAVRVGKDGDCGAATVLQAPESFEREAKIKPPFPSAANYDAKAWQFIERKASEDALFWNVGA